MICRDRVTQECHVVRGIDRARILCVSPDISKYFYLVMMHNAYGEIVTPSFEIDIFRSGFEHLCQVIDLLD